MEESTQEEYKEENFWEKLKSNPKNIGCDLIYKALTLYYTMQNPEIPKWAKVVIIGALVYLINPFDAIPDITPGIGYSDDLGVISFALMLLETLITDEDRQKARDKAKELFNCEFEEEEEGA